MANYKDIHGTTVRNSAGNLTSAKEGELFFDSTNLDFKYRFPNVTSAGSWRTGGNLNTARYQLGAAGVDQNAVLVFGGTPPVTAKTESYNGSNWTEVNDLGSARRLGAGGGTATAAIYAGGHEPPPTAQTETWNGSNWTEDGDLSTGRDGGGGSGISNTSGLYFGGRNEPSVYANTEEFTGAGATVTRTFTDS